MVKRPWLWLGVAAVAIVLVAAAIAGAPSPVSQPGTPFAVRDSAGAAGASLPLGPVASTLGGSTTASAWASGRAGDGTGVAPPIGTQEPLGTLLAMLRIAPEARAGYERSLFVHWIDADGDGCDTRHEVLIQEAIVKPTVGPRCSLTGGQWFSLYDGLTFTDPARLQIDHVVPLAEAWDSGASAWTPDRRMRFANDLDAWFALIAVSAASNESKADGDPADWMPPAAAAECPYLGAWLATKVRWDLAMDGREHDAIATDITACPSTTMPYLPAGPAGETGGPPLSTPMGTGAVGPSPGDGSCDPAYPTVCIPPPPPDLDCGDIPYRNFRVLPPDPHHFDGDGDGIGCET